MAAAQREIAWLRRTVDGAAGHAVVTMDSAGQVTGWNRSAEVITGFPAADMLGCPVGPIFTADEEALPPELRALRAGSLEIERWLWRRDHSRFWASGTIAVVGGGECGPEGFLAIFRDRSTSHAEMEQLKLLADEMRHRLKNSYALVQAIAAQTARHATSPDGFAASFASRLSALSRSNDLLAATGRDDVPLACIVETALAPYADDRQRTTATGPAATLPAEHVVMIALMLHELATNAAKYGALSAPCGRVAVSWTVDDDPRQIELTWQEQGGPPVRPPTYRGFGSRILTRGRSSGVAADVDFRPDGLKCSIRLSQAESHQHGEYE